MEDHERNHKAAGCARKRGQGAQERFTRPVIDHPGLGQYGCPCPQPSAPGGQCERGQGCHDQRIRQGIKIGKLDLESSMEDFRVMLERTGMAAKWDEAVVSGWVEKERATCGA